MPPPTNLVVAVAPQSPNSEDNIRVATASHPGFHLGEGVATTAAATPGLHNNHGHAPTIHANDITSTSAPPEKQKRQRKKKDVTSIGPDGKPVDNGKLKEKKPRKPREPKDKTTTSSTTSGAAAPVPRKKVKTEPKTSQVTTSTARQPTIMEMVSTFAAPPPAVPFSVPPLRPQSSTVTAGPGINAPNTLIVPASSVALPRPISSGQNYDPIRGYDPVRSITVDALQTRPANTPSVTPLPHVNRASASPSLARLLDPPLPPASLPSIFPATLKSMQPIMQQPSVPTQTDSPQQSMAVSLSPAPQQPHLSTAVSLSATDTSPKRVDIPNVDGAMDVDLTCEAPVARVEVKVSSVASSGAPTPKAARPTPPPAPKGTGSGLLSSSDLFGGRSTNGDSKRKGVDIDFQIPLNPEGGNTINIAQEILKRYGRDAINPRVAAHREELLRVAAEANKLDNGLNDDMSIDEMSEPENDSNVEMGGMEDEKSATSPDNKPVRKRRKKIEEYDKEDDFIDDTELAWQERAAVAKDGFFVYSGPLVPVGQDAQVESATSTRGGRGRGRARGGRGGATTTGTTHASMVAAKKAIATNGTTANTSDDTHGAPTRARGRGRGTGAPRKPRITKADRERMEMEKLNRAKAAGLGGPTGGAIALATPPTIITSARPAEAYQHIMGSTAG